MLKTIFTKVTLTKLNSFHKIINRKIHFDFDPSKDYYKTLGVEKNSSEQQIKAAYYKLAKEFHPDKNQGKTLEKFKEINNAYDTLSDRTKRSQYDSMRSAYSFGGFQRSKPGNQYNQYKGGASSNQQQDPFQGFDEFYNRMKNEFKKTNFYSSRSTGNQDSAKQDDFKKEYYSGEKKKEFYKSYFDKNKKYYKQAHFTNTNENSSSHSRSGENFKMDTNNINYYSLFMLFGGLFFIYILIRANSHKNRELHPPVGYKNPPQFQPKNDPSSSYQGSTLYTNTTPSSYSSSSNEYSNESSRFK